ncbi:MAG: ATP-binding protein [Bacteroidales bacterium]|nr:ATP-binding protein [Bacteroidales bacterium]MDT8431578.1 ATP-binding protein [Bacteroidales bacterium]
MMDRQKLKDVILDQRSLSLKPDDVLRHTSIIEDNEVVVLSGVRRCGKSTLIQEIRSKQNESDYFFNFDDERVLKFTVNDFQILTELFIELFGKQNTYYFNEIQNIEGWERYIRRLRDYGSKVFVTGSNASMLSRELGTHLTGRYVRKELFPFSFKEFLRLKDVDYHEVGLLSTNEKALLKGQFNSYFESGGFPAYLKSGNREYLKSLYESVLYRDVMVRNNLTNEKELLELVYYISSNVGKRMSYNGMAKVVGVKNATTISNYIAFLQDSYLVFMVKKYDVSLKKQIQNAKKGYLIDLGLLRTLAFHHTEDNGRLLENLVFLELIRNGKEVYYHHQKKECDFVIKEKTKIAEAIQVSWNIEDESTYNREIAGLLDAVNAYGLREGLILTESEEREFELDGVSIRIKPVWKWLLE